MAHDRQETKSKGKAVIGMACLSLLQAQSGQPVAPREVFIFAAIGAAAILSAWAIRKALAGKRTQALTDAAVQIGFTFGGEDWPDEDWPDKGRVPMLDTALFSKGRTHQSKNIMIGSGAGFRISLFDYSFVMGSGKSEHTYAQTVASFSKDNVYFPYFEMCPANLLKRAWDAVSHKNIHFDANPEFARRYALQGALPEKVRELFAPSLISFMEGLDPREKWHIEGAGNTLVVYRASKKAAPAELRNFLDQTTAIATGFFSFAASTAATIESAK